MNASVYFCLLFVVTLWGRDRGGHAYEIVVRPNVRSADCPHGNVYAKECRKCFCKPNVNNATHWPYPYCRKDSCDGWTCPDPPTFERECEGQCACDALTSVTTCDKYCVPKMQGHGKHEFT